MDVFIARQPILDRHQRLFGYELLFRSGLQNAFPNVDPDYASRKLVADSLMVTGLEALTGGRPAFINLTRDFLVSRHYRVLPRDAVVLELLESVEPDREVLAAVRQAHDAGYRLALDDLASERGWESVLPLLSFIKIDVLQSDAAERRRMAALFAPLNVSLLAEKVEDRPMFDATGAEGYRYFQGYFFARPAIVARKDIATQKWTLLRVLQEIHRPELDLPELERLIEHELGLSYKLLRYVGSAHFGWRHPVESIRHALLLLGEEEFRRWASVVVVAGMASDKPDALVTEAVLRGRYCQLLAGPLGVEERSLDLFLLGLLSLLDAVLDRPLEEILAEIAIADEIRDALLGGPGKWGDALRLVVAHLRGEWPALEEPAARLGIALDVLPALHANAVGCATQGPAAQVA